MQQDNETIPGHTFLAKLGKKRLRPGGLLLTHDVMIVNNEYVIKELCEAINIKVQPLTYDK